MAGGVEVRGLSGLAANFRAFDREVQRRVRAVVQASGQQQQRETAAECPKDSGYMASKTRLDLSPQGLTYSVGYDPQDFPRAFYPHFVIFGTSRMPGNNFLFRVHERRAPQFTREVGDAVRGASGGVGR